MKLEYIMKIFVRLNIVSALYALALFFQFQLMGNIYRIDRITGWPGDTVNLLVAIFSLIVFIISTIVFFFITRKYFNRGKIRFLLTILWVPYFILFCLIASYLFPIPRAEEPPPVVGLLIIAVLLIYPFYIAYINVISSKECHQNL